MFVSLAGATTIGLLNELLNTAIPSVIGSLLLVPQPYFLLRLVRYFHSVPRWVHLGAVFTLAVSWLIIIAGGLTLHLGFTVVIVLYFVLVDSYAMVNFIREARNTHGVTHKRLRFTAVGSGLLAFALGLVGIGALFPGGARVLLRLVQVTALGSALTFYLGLAPPHWLRRIWQLQERHHFQLQLSHSPTTIVEMYNILCQAAQNSIGGSQVAIAYHFDDRANAGLRLHRPGQPERDCPMLGESQFFTWHGAQDTAVIVPLKTLTPTERSFLQPG
jgi:hypothetical protein